MMAGNHPHLKSVFNEPVTTICGGPILRATPIDALQSHSGFVPAHIAEEGGKHSYRDKLFVFVRGASGRFVVVTTRLNFPCGRCMSDERNDGAG